MSSQSQSILQKYIDEIDQDVELNNFNVKDVQLKLPAIKHKYVSRLIAHKRRLSSLYRDKSIKQDKVITSLKEQSVYKLTDAMAKKAASSHNNIKDIDVAIAEEKSIIELLEKVEKILSSMTYDIKNLIELMKMEIT